MKLIFGVLCVIVVATAFPRHKRGQFGDIDPVQIINMLNNVAFVNAQHRCLIASDADANVLCDRMGKKLRGTLAETIRKADCGEECTAADKQTLVLIINIVRNKYTQMWKDIVSYYNITEDQIKKLDEWAQENFTSTEISTEEEQINSKTEPTFNENKTTLN